MIDKMLKTTVVCLADDREKSLLGLRELGCLHVTGRQGEGTAQLKSLREEVARSARLLNFLATQKWDGQDLPREATPCQEGDACRRDCLDAWERLRKAQEELPKVERALQQLRPWGHFDASLLQRLQEKGWHTALLLRNGRTQEGWLKEWKECPKGTRELLVSRQGDQVRSLVISPAPLDKLPIPPQNFPDGTDLQALEDRAEALRQEARNALETLRRHWLMDEALLRKEHARLEREAEFLATRDGMGRSGKALAYLQGFLPADPLDALREAAARHGWALRYQEVAPDDPLVPTKLTMPRHCEMAKVILDFIGILPGYGEVDISVAVMLFLSLFCGMLVGDAGYGAIFTALSLWGLHRARKSRPDLLPTMKLMTGMSLCILAWGALSGNWFGLGWGGLKCLTDGDRGQLNVQLFCFFLAAIHLSLAHLWKVPLSRTWRGKLGNLGWAIFLWANFFTVKCLLIDNSFAHFTIPSLMYGAGTVLIVLFSIQWNNMGDVIYSPFTFINSLSDLLSYIRLYAVGLSSVYIARAFNDMSAMLWEKNAWLLPVGLVIVLAGHLLNVAMALMSVLVHGIRLNSLEFSGHIGVEWGGRPYRPFR